MRIILLTISILAMISCEKVVIIELPDEQNLPVVEGWITDINQRQHIRLTRSNSFSGFENQPIEGASVIVEIQNSGTISYSYAGNGNYFSDNSFAGINGNEYRAIITMPNGDLVRSGWTAMPAKTKIVLLSIGFFEENDTENPGQTKTIYFPRITARDSTDFDNFYRWIFYKDKVRLNEPESITLQKDIFFDGNFIPNFFDEFEFESGNEIKVELHSIEERTHDYLSLLKSQITTLGGAASTTPAVVNGNLTNLTNSEEVILGFFGTTAIGADSISVQ